MKLKLGPKGMKTLKIIHILSGVMWIGGVMALVSLLLGTHPSTPEQMLMAATDHLVIDVFFLIPGGMAIVFTSLCYSLLTPWGFSKIRWVSVKWILTVLLVLLGKVYMGVILEQNVLVAQHIAETGIVDNQFWENINGVAIAGCVQLVGFITIVVLSVLKPWTSSKSRFTKRNVILLLAGLAFHTVGKLLHLRDVETLFYPGVAFFIAGHICYLYALISSLGKLTKWQIAILLCPLLIFWIPAFAMKSGIPMAIVISIVMLSIFLYISSGITGISRKQKGYVFTLLAGVLFLISDVITGISSSDTLHIISQAAFYLAEISVVISIVRISKYYGENK